MTGSIGLLGTRPSYEMMMNCDTLLTVGSSFPYTQFLPAFDQARAVQIDIDGKFIGMRYPYELNLVGDSAATLRALIPHLRRKEDRSWREGIEDNVAKWWRSMAAEAEVEADPINPMLVFRELSSRLPENAIVSADSGSSANWYARQLKFRGDMRGSLSGNLATMGPGVPYGIGAKFGYPDRPVIVFRGRGHADERSRRADHGQALLGAVVGLPADHRGAAQQRPQPGHLGDAGDGGGAEVHRVPDPPRRVLRGIRPQSRPERHRRRQAGAGRPRLGPGPRSRPPDGARLQDRPRRAADSAACHLRADKGRRHGAAEGRPEQVGGHQGRPDGQGQGSHARQRQLTRRPNGRQTLAVVFGKCLTFRWSSSVQVPAMS